MQQTTNYSLNKFDSTDALETASRLALNDNADKLDVAIKTNADDIDAVELAIQTLAADDVSYDNTNSGLVATDLQDATDELSGKISILSNYSTNEQVVGTWVDGKPIYRKRFTGTTGASGTATTIGSNTIYDTIVNAYGSPRGVKIGSYLNANFFCGLYTPASHTLDFYYPDNANWHSLDFDIVVEYTKTTD